MLAATGPSPLWYLTRGTGLVVLILLSASVALGIANLSRWTRPGWPRFATAGLHRNVSLLVVVLLAIHILTAELDTFAPVGWLAVVVPFASSYRPVWLGLGTLASDLVVALTITSLLRRRLGYQAWRAVHWLAYLSWPVAVVHGLGTGSDIRLGWVQFVVVGCVAVVVGAVWWRLAQSRPSRTGTRLAAGAAGLAVLAVAAGWAVTGPLRPGWAGRAGTPRTLLATATAPASSVAEMPGAAATGSAPSRSTAEAIPPLPFSAALVGNLVQRGAGSSGQVTITIDAHVSGAATANLHIVLRGQAADGGVSLSSSTVTFGPTAAAGQYQGRVVALSGEQLVASVRSRTGTALDLGIDLRIDPSSGSVQGSLHARAAA